MSGYESMRARMLGSLPVREHVLTTPVVKVQSGRWQCPRCAFHRTYATAAGAMEGISQHLLVAHRIRLAIPRRHHGGLFGGGK